MRGSPVNDEKLLLEMSETDVTIFRKEFFIFTQTMKKLRVSGEN